MDTERFRNIFAGLEERFGYHIANYDSGNGKKSGDSFTSNYPHALEMWQSHLEGKKFKVKTQKGRIIEADSLVCVPLIIKVNVSGGLSILIITNHLFPSYSKN